MCCVGFTAVLSNFAHNTTTIIIIMVIFYMFIRERAHGLCLERERLSEQHPINDVLQTGQKKNLEGDLMNSVRLPIGATGDS